MVKVLVVDDDDFAREGVRSILSTCSHLVFECSGIRDLDSALQAAGGEVDVALVDLLLEGHRTGLEVMEAINNGPRPRPKLVVLTNGETMSRPQLLCRAHLWYHLDGALPKRRFSQSLRASIEKVCKGQTAFHPDLIPYLTESASIDPLFSEKSHASIWIALAAGFGGGHGEISNVTGLGRKHVGNTISEMRHKLVDYGNVSEDELPRSARSGVLAALTRFATSHREYILYWASVNRNRFELAKPGHDRLAQYEQGEI